MFGSALLFVLFIGLAVFMANRLYVGLSHGEINVRGWNYSRQTAPFQFWSTMLFASLGLLFSLAILIAGAIGILGF